MESCTKCGMKLTPLRLTAHLKQCDGNNPAMSSRAGRVKSATMQTSARSSVQNHASEGRQAQVVLPAPGAKEVHDRGVFNTGK